MGVSLHLASVPDANIAPLGKHPLLFKQTRHTSQQHPELMQLHISLGEYWHGIHYLLCGKAWQGEYPASFLLDGGSYLGSVDFGNGAPRLFGSAEVKEIAQLLDCQRPEQLAQRFDPYRMVDEEVYHPHASWDNDGQALSQCLENFKLMRHFTRHTAENDLGMAVYLMET